MLVQRMELGEPDDSGRRRPVPIEGDTYELPVETVITAVSQKPDLAPSVEELGDGGSTLMSGVRPSRRYLDRWRQHQPRIATTSIGQGRKAAESIHATSSSGSSPSRTRQHWSVPKRSSSMVRGQGPGGAKVYHPRGASGQSVPRSTSGHAGSRRSRRPPGASPAASASAVRTAGCTARTTVSQNCRSPARILLQDQAGGLRRLQEVLGGVPLRLHRRPVAGRGRDEKRL